MRTDVALWFKLAQLFNNNPTAMHFFLVKLKNLTYEEAILLMEIRSYLLDKKLRGETRINYLTYMQILKECLSISETNS